MKREPRHQGSATARRVRCSTSTISMPKTITSKLPLVPSSPGSRSCSHRFSTVITPAPRPRPRRWGRTADDRHEQILDADVSRMASDSRSAACARTASRGAGEQAARMNDHHRERAVSTPIASAITMPPRSARIALPSRESSRLLVDHNTPASTKKPDQVVDALALASARSRTARSAGCRSSRCGRPESPWCRTGSTGSAPGDGRQRQVVPGQAQGELADQEGHRRGEHQPDGRASRASHPGQPAGSSAEVVSSAVV